ncbi:MAG: tripartite tricarboxylate transporter substrate binding protein [Burkholderiales bacterium]
MKRVLFAAVLAVCCLGAGASMAQGYPTRPITMVVAYPPGGSTDGLARIVAAAMAKNLAQQIIVENVGGAGGTIGTQRVLKSSPDGYMITFGNMGSLAIAGPLYPNIKFDPVRDLAPIGLVADVPMVLSASIKSGYTTLQQLLDQLRKDGAAVNFGTAGPGSTGHIGAVLFLHVTRNNATLVSYRGAGPALADLMAGTVDTVIDQTVTMIPIHKGGRVRALAVSGKQRVEQIPDVPTFAEAGAPAFDLSVWNGIAAPAGTPQAVVDRLAQALAAALKDPEVIDRFGKMAAVIPPLAEQGPKPFAALIARDVVRFSELIQATGLKPGD